MPYPRPNPRERALLYSIWAVFGLVACLYWFWPRLTEKGLPKIQVQIAPELQGWFAEAKLVDIVSGGLAVDLKFQDKPLDSLNQVRSVHLGYDFGREKEILYRGHVVWNPVSSRPVSSISANQKRGPSSSDKVLRLLLPNPQSTAPQWIRLYFADSR